ncbi:MAG: hypothetical protein P1P86_15520 [Bacteroidales bacterium]|nr:hypothetical protein [Bacteroidales bacterium]
MQVYLKTDSQLHWLSQVIARINRTFVPAQEDASHTNLYFDPIRRVISGRWIDTPQGKLLCFLDLNTLAFKWQDQSKSVLWEVPLLNAGLEELLAGTGEYLLKSGMDIEGLEDPGHSGIPAYGIRSINDEELSESGIKQWGYYRGLANIACFDMLGYLQSESEVRIWPHHFDTGIYTLVNKQLGLGFGLAMKDSMVGAPYFYLSGYGDGMAGSFQGLPGLSAGHWETGEHWKGAVLPLSDISKHSYGEALEQIRNFIEQASSWFLHHAK